MKQMKKLLSVFFTIVPLFVVAQNIKPVNWQYAIHQLSDMQAELEITATIKKDWHLYSQYQDGIAQALVFTLNPNESYRVADTSAYFIEPDYTEQYNADMDDTERYFTDKVVFKRLISIQEADRFSISGNIEGQACSEGSCVFIRESFSLSLPEKSSSKMLAENAENNISTTEERSLWVFFLIAFAGGLLGIFTPCVFPMIPMTISFFMKRGGKKQAVFYGLSIVFVYLVIGIVLSAIFGQGFANFISTHWIPNVLFAIIFILFAVSLFGYFEMTLPSSWINKSAGKEEKEGYIGTFFMALTLVLVSFSCTLPIAGAVALGAADGSFLKPIIGMLGFSLAFALPFTFFAFFPNLLKNMPKSGAWMNTIKVTLAFVELAFALKFISVPDQTYHWGILDREVFLSLWIVLFSLLGFYLLGKIRFPYDEEQAVQKSWIKFFLSIATFSFVVYMIPGLWGAPLNSLSGWLPPMKTQDFNMKEIVYEGRSLYQDNYAIEKTASFSDKLSLITGLQKGYFDYDQALANAKIQNKPLFLDFTGHGCVNCRKVEQEVLSDNRIQQLLNEKFVVCALYVDDKTIALPEHLQIKNDKGVTITMLGEKNMYLQNKLFHENSQPCYIVIDPHTEKILSGPCFYETNVDKYKAFLLKALE